VPPSLLDIGVCVSVPRRQDSDDLFSDVFNYEGIMLEK
jgi:hypothetical protein